MDVTGTIGTAWRHNELVGEFVLRGGREAGAGGRVAEHVEILFPSFLAVAIRPELEKIVKKERLPEALILDLELADGRKISGCEVAGFWGGELGERWFGIDLDLDELARESLG